MLLPRGKFLKKLLFKYLTRAQYTTACGVLNLAQITVLVGVLFAEVVRESTLLLLKRVVVKVCFHKYSTNVNL